MPTHICHNCQSSFDRPLKDSVPYNKGLQKHIYCSYLCWVKFNDQEQKVIMSCSQCSKEIYRRKYQIRSSKTGRFFCNRSCAVTYNNTHKTYGIRRSKIEIYLESELKIRFPNLDILFNDKSTINSELDIYIPSLKLAFELNGIFHYEPIYGKETLEKIQNNDARKFQACLENNIELCLIDISSIINFTSKSGKKFLDIIISVINLKL